MNGTVELADMGEDEILALAGERADTIREAEADLLRIAFQWAVIHDPDRLDEEESGRPGREKARMYGGEGTPRVTEFAAAALGARIGVTTWAAGRLMADALDLQHRCPKVWARVEAGEVKASYARHVASETRHLPRAEAGAVDEMVAQPADGRIPWTRFQQVVEAAIAKADPEVACEKERQAQEATFARKLRDEGNGMGSFLIRAPIWMINQIAAAASAYSAAIKDDLPQLTDDERDVFALLMLLTPGADQDVAKLADTAPVVHLYVHTYAGTPDAPHEGVNRLEGHGPVTDEWVREVLGPHCRFKIHPVIDIAGMAPVDAYEIPDRHRQAVHLMTPADVFPHGSSLSRTTQVDHTEPYVKDGPAGQSRIGNYGPLTIPHHRIKTHGGWDVKQPFPGIYVWRDSHGGYHLVDNTGTRKLTQQAESLPLVVEIYRQLPQIDWVA